MANMLPTMKRKKELLENDIEIATDELTALQKQKEQYGDSLKNQTKYTKLELENNYLKQELNTIRTGIQRLIVALDKSNDPISNKVKKVLKGLINKNNNIKTLNKDETER